MAENRADAGSRRRAAVGALVEEFHGRVLADPALRDCFAGVDMSMLKDRQTDYLCEALCCIPLFRGRRALSVHAGFCAAPPQFQLVAKHLSDALQIMEAKAGEVVALVRPMKKELVVG